MPKIGLFCNSYPDIIGTNGGHTVPYAPAQNQKGGILLKHVKWMTLLTLMLCALLATPALADNQYYAVREPIEIASSVRVTVSADAISIGSRTA